MKLKTLNIRNFKGIESASYSPKHKIAILMGENGKGKTSFLEAIRYLLTGDSPANCIRHGALSTLVSANIDGIGNISREKSDKPTKVKVNGRITPAKNLDSMIETAAGVNKDALKITTSAEVVNGLSAAEFGDFIMQYIPEELDFRTIQSYITGLTSDGEKELLMIFPEAPTKFGTDKIIEAQDYFTDLRKTLKKEIQVREAKTKTFIGTKPRRTLSDIETELKSLIAAEGSVAAVKATIAMYNAAVENKKKVENDLRSLRTQIDAIVATKPNPDALKKIREKIEYHRKEVIAAEKISQTIRDNIDLFTNAIENLSKPFCPLSESLVCTTDKSAIREEFEENLIANREGLEIQQEVIVRNKEEIQKLMSEEQAYLKNEAEYNKKALLNSRYEKAKKAIPVVPAKPEISEVKDFKDEIRRIQSERDAFNAYLQNEKIENEITILNKRLQLICFLLKSLEAKGEVMSNIMTHYMSLFEGVINTRADELGTGIKIQFIADQGVNFFVQTKSSTGFLPYSSLSHGEQTVAMFLLLDMLNTLCGTKMLLMDDLNHLDKNSLETLIFLIASKPVQDSYDHIFISSVNNADMVDVASKYLSEIDLIF